jgi:NAD(P)H-dependent flavin oxidoreductase YrpB (nitropropane dioxygenase family)
MPGTAPMVGCPVEREENPSVSGRDLPVQDRRLPIIQGGMGVGVSGWRLARAVAVAGQLGVVSGVGLDTLMARRLQLGDPGGHIQWALGSFPHCGVAEQIVDRYFVPGGIAPDEPFRPVPGPSLKPSVRSTNLVVAANFVEVFLAKEGHAGLVGINFMEKLQMSTPAASYGAMLAGVDYVLVGAGIPAEFPALLDALAAGRPGQVSVDVIGAGAVPTTVVRPETMAGATGELKRPKFLAIVASHVLASYLARDARTRPDGFVVEGPVAGGHSAPPRGPLVLDDVGEPVYGPRDLADLDKMAFLGLPYWLAGGYARPDLLAEVRRAGAAGVQVGSAFALCEESGLLAGLKQSVIEQALSTGLVVRADPRTSPTGFPFKVADLAGTVAEAQVYDKRDRVCDAGYLRAPYRKHGSEIGYRCPAEPLPTYLRKGGKMAETVGRCCLCNGLIAAIGLGQRRRDGTEEPPIVTIGQDLSFLPRLVASGRGPYRAADVVAYLLQKEGTDIPEDPGINRGRGGGGQGDGARRLSPA